MCQDPLRLQTWRRNIRNLENPPSAKYKLAVIMGKGEQGIMLDKTCF